MEYKVEKVGEKFYVFKYDKHGNKYDTMHHFDNEKEANAFKEKEESKDASVESSLKYPIVEKILSARMLDRVLSGDMQELYGGDTQQDAAPAEGGNWDMEAEDIENYIMNVEPLYQQFMNMNNFDDALELARMALEDYKAQSPSHNVMVDEQALADHLWNELQGEIDNGVSQEEQAIEEGQERWSETGTPIKSEGSMLAKVLASDEDTYEIIRHYKNDSSKNKTMKKGLTRQEAQEWCKDPETSSRTAEEPENVKHTEENGEWFDGFEKE